MPIYNKNNALVSQPCFCFLTKIEKIATLDPQEVFYYMADQNKGALEQGSGELQERMKAVIEAAIEMNAKGGTFGPSTAQKESAD